MPVVVELPQIAVVGVDNPFCIVGPLQSIQGSEFGLDGNAFIDGRHAHCLPSEILVEAEPLDILLCLPESESHAGPQTDIVRAGPLLDHIPRYLQHLRIGSPSRRVKP